MKLQFLHPEWLWLLPPAWIWIVWLARHSFVQTHYLRRTLACAIRLGVATALILALAGVQWMSPIEGMNIFFVLDRSDSVSPSRQEEARDWVRQIIAQKPSSDGAGVIVFGTEAGIESSARPAPNLDGAEVVVPTARTDIGSALRLAAAAFPEHGQRRMVLISDGNENLGDALAAAASARALEVNVDVVPLPTEKKADVSIRRLQMPPAVKRGQSFEVKVFIEADQAGPATLRLYRNEQHLGEQTVDLEAGKNLLVFPQSLADEGFYTFDARIDAAGDAVPGNNRSFAFTRVRGNPRVLILSSDPAADAILSTALASPDLEVRLVGVNRFPESLAELQSYDSVIFSNVAAADLSADQQTLLETAVRDFGTGFVCIGGDQSYAAGAYRGTPIANVLPVDVDLSSRKVLPPGALVLVIDKSGSMSGEKLEMARQGAMAAVEALADSDYVGVIGFDGEPFIVAPMQRAAGRKQILRNIAGIGLGGGTSLYPPMVRAREMLLPVPAAIKHCVLLTDGMSTPGDFEGITRAMVADRITISTVAVGPDSDAALLEGIATGGGGRFYFVPAPSQLPQIFTKETAVVLKSAINEEPFVPQVAVATELVRGISGYPELLGCVVTEPRPRAETPLLTGAGDPLLAHWQYGLGRSVAFTSDARPKWARNWLAWDQFRQFWLQIVQWTLPRISNLDFTTEITTVNGEGHVSVEALDDGGRYRDFLDLRGTVAGPGGERQSIRLRQTAPGHYEGTFPMPEPGAYLLNLMQLENSEIVGAQVVGASLNHSPELDSRGTDLNLLRRVAETTGGKLLDPTLPGSNPYYGDRRRTWQPHDLWRWLLQAAVVAFVLDVGLRRVSPDPQQIDRIRRALFGVVMFWRRKRPVSVESEPGLAALLARREEVRSGQAAPILRIEPLQSPGGTRTSVMAEAAVAGRSGIPARPPEPEPDLTDAPASVRTTDRLLEAKRRLKRRG